MLRSTSRRFGDHRLSLPDGSFFSEDSDLSPQNPRRKWFVTLDKDKSGLVHPHELEAGLKSMRIPRKYRTPKVVDGLVNILC